MLYYLLKRSEFGSRRFQDLTRAICEAAMFEGHPKMNDIADAFRGERTRSCVLKSMERAVEELWLETDHKEMGTIYRGWEYDQPTAKEFIYVMSRKLRGEEPYTRPHLLQALPHRGE